MVVPMDSLKTTWGQRVREARQAAGLTQRTLAIRLGCAQQTLSAIENGERLPGDDLRLRLAAALGKDPNELFRYPEPERAA